MNTSRFLKRLLDELPRWRELGWVTAENADAIVEDLRARESRTHPLAYALGIFGVLLLGAGIISWLAANWQEIGKLGKLAILLGSMYLAYGIAGGLLREERYPAIGQAVLLLGVILFGANIQLIAQMYHIDAHYPNGILMWALGGLATACLLKSQPAFIATMVLALMWSGSESGGFHHVHGWFLVLWLTFLPAIYLWNWQRSFIVALVTLCLWSVITFFVVETTPGTGASLFVLQLWFLLYVAAFIGGLLLDTWWPTVRFAGAVQGAGVAGTLVCGYVLTFPDLQSGSFGWEDGSFRAPAEPFWMYLNYAGIALVVLLSAAHFLRTRAFTSMGFLQYGRAILALALVLFIVSLHVNGVHGGPIAIAINLLYFAGVIWLVYAGMNLGNRVLVNLGFVFFAITLISRYADTFWSLLNRSFFFMLGGVILIVGGYLLERQRRRITARLDRERSGGVP